VEIKAVPSELVLSEVTTIVGVMTDLEPVPGFEDEIAAIDDSLLDLAKFEGKNGQVLRLPHGEASALLLVGLGDEATFESIRTAAGNAVRAVETASAVTGLNTLPIDGAQRAVAEGAILGGYEFREYKTEGDPLKLETLHLVDADEMSLAEAVAIAEATNLARDWINTPALNKAPADLADRMGATARAAGLTVEIWDRERIEDEELGALLGVAAGSDRDPRLVILGYEPEDAKGHLGLVGKGITFDSGGLSLKSAAHMEEMKDDMSGAAAVSAATVAIAKLGVPLRVTTVVPLTDNAVGGHATRPGDVLRPVSGPTIEVLNTDAEGRLVLADGLGVAQRYEPDMIIDVATLTGAARVSLGDKIGAVFASSSEVAAAVLEGASRAGENFWELPLFQDYKKSLESDIADIKNISGTRYGGAIVAALFLSHYAGDGPWAHLDIAGPARSRETAGEFVKGASGIAVRTLVEIARGMAEPD
jgi:leucyl aminopeptidase